MIKQAFYLLCALHCTMQAMELDTPSEVRSKIVKCNFSLNQAIRKSLKHGIIENIVYYNLWQDSEHGYKRSRIDIKEYFSISNQSKPYILLCSVCLRSKNRLNCDIFDTKTQEWISGQQIQFNEDANVFSIIPSWVPSSDISGGFCKSTYPILDAQCAIIDISDFYVPMDLCYGLAQALKGKNIPVIFNVQKRLLGADPIGKKSSWSEFIAALPDRVKNMMEYHIIDERIKQEQVTLEKQKDDQNIQSPSFITPTRIAIGCLIMAIGIICWKTFYK